MALLPGPTFHGTAKPQKVQKLFACDNCTDSNVTIISVHHIMRTVTSTIIHLAISIYNTVWQKQWLLCHSLWAFTTSKADNKFSACIFSLKTANLNCDNMSHIACWNVTCEWLCSARQQQTQVNLIFWKRNPQYSDIKSETNSVGWLVAQRPTQHSTGHFGDD